MTVKLDKITAKGIVPVDKQIVPVDISVQSCFPAKTFI